MIPPESRPVPRPCARCGQRHLYSGASPWPLRRDDSRFKQHAIDARRRHEAFRLRRQGLPFSAIGERLGVTRARAQRRVKRHGQTPQSRQPAPRITLDQISNDALLFLFVDIDGLALTVRSYSLLRTNEFRSAGDVAVHTAAELRQLRRVGTMVVSDVREALLLLGLDLGLDIPDWARIGPLCAALTTPNQPYGPRTGQPLPWVCPERLEPATPSLRDVLTTMPPLQEPPTSNAPAETNHDDSLPTQ